MSSKQEKIRKGWLSNLYSIVTMLTLFVIMAQVIIARRSMVESSEWEKAKMTIENIERFKENLKETALYGKTEILFRADRGFPDFTTPEGFIYADTLTKTYLSICHNDGRVWLDDFLYSISIMDAFAYPIIMGYASEMGSYRSVFRDYQWYCNYIMPLALHNYKPDGVHAKLLFRLWRVKAEILYLPNWDIEILKNDLSHLLCFEEDEVTPATLKQYEKKLEKELKKIQKEIEDFRKSSLK